MADSRPLPHPPIIWATVNGTATSLPDGGRHLIGGWSETSDRKGSAVYVRADLVPPEALARVDYGLAVVVQVNGPLRADCDLYDEIHVNGPRPAGGEDRG